MQNKNKTTMQDQAIMTDLLNATKGVCDLHLHGTIESATPNVHQAFDKGLDTALKMQNDIYSKMQDKGWYPAEAAQKQQIQKVKQKYQASTQQKKSK